MRHAAVTFLAYLGGMSRRICRSAALPAVLAVTGSLQAAGDSGALIDALIRKGILTQQEAEDIRAELVRDAATKVPADAIANGRSTERLSIGMRIQAHFAHLHTEIAGAPGSAQPPAINHAALRRMYLTLRAGIGAGWEATMTYDLAAGRYDDAFIGWRPSDSLTFGFGLRKVATAFEERYTSADLRALERSPVTRYFVEVNNGRRLGAGSHRIGVFVDGRHTLRGDTAFVYTAAITNPERPESFSAASSFGDGNVNQLAVWSTVGLAGRIAGTGTWTTAIGAGYLPDQGGFGTANLGRGADLTLYSASVNIQAPRWGFMAEYLTADVERGSAIGTDARPAGLFVQPTLYLTETIEAAFRFSWIDSDRRGLTINDVIRNAVSGGIMNSLEEYYAGVNWYVRGNDLKVQLGGVYGKTKDTVTGAPAEAKATGVRSQMQIQF